MFFNDDKEEILEKIADILATCKHKLDHKECTLEKCNNCSFGYVLQFSKKYMSEMELDYIKMLSQLQYENTEYTPDNDDENDDSDEDNHKFLIVQSWSDIKTFNEIFKRLYPDYNIELKEDDISTIIDKLTHYNWGFSDEYDICFHCNKVVHTQDYLNINYIINDYELICNDCLHKELDTQKSYCEYLENNPKTANYDLTDDELENLGYIKLDKSYENGWYGKTDNPKSILKELLEEEPDGKFIFSVTNFHQFATYFEVWRKK